MTVNMLKANGVDLAYDSFVLNPAVEAIPDGLRDKHFFRKHGSEAYYGQTTKG